MRQIMRRHTGQPVRVVCRNSRGYYALNGVWIIGPLKVDQSHVTVTRSNSRTDTGRRAESDAYDSDDTFVPTSDTPSDDDYRKSYDDPGQLSGSEDRDEIGLDDDAERPISSGDQCETGSNEDSEELEHDEHLTEDINDHRILETGDVEYLVKWKGFSTEHNSWEPMHNFYTGNREEGNAVIKEYNQTRLCRHLRQICSNDMPRPRNDRTMSEVSHTPYRQLEMRLARVETVLVDVCAAHVRLLEKSTRVSTE